MNNTQMRGGDLLGRYELLLPIAKGGMAEVWLARLSGTRGFRKIVAIKTILRGAIDDARMEQMFIEEATLASQIHHPNTVEILDFGEHEGTLFIAMEWVEGEPLNVIVAEASKHGGLPLPMAVNVLGQACKGLHAAHELRDEGGHSLGIVHRDISPQNLIVSYTGTVKVLDFGIAKATSQVSTLTEAGEVKGKFAYMSPEQVSGGTLDRRSDIFSLAVLGYMLTTGRHPFRGQNSAETVKRIFSPEPAPPPSSFIPDFPKALEAALLRALEKRPEDRFQSAHDFLSALEDVAPEYLENSFEVKLGAYMRELLGPRQAERRQKLRLAEESAGKEGSGMMLASTSNGSLGAVSIDGGRATGSNASARLPVLSEPGSGSLPTGIAPAANRTKWIVGAPLASAALVAVGFFLSRGLGAGRETPHSAAAGSNAADPSAIPSERRVPMVELSAATSPPPPPQPSAAPEPPATSAATNNASRAVRGRRGPLPHAASKADPSATPNTAPAAPAAAPASATPAPTNNSWDRSTFGGRY
jgi:serine/threonine-protein kinase